MKPVNQYPISFSYGATSYPYSASRPHRGNDRACPKGTPIIIGGTTIGLVGSTGWATGSHLHTQAGTDEWCQKTINPTSLEFKAGTVIHTGEATQWGKYIILKVGTKYICYAHLSKINVKQGDKIVAELDGRTIKEWRDVAVRNHKIAEARGKAIKALEKKVKDLNESIKTLKALDDKEDKAYEKDIDALQKKVDQLNKVIENSKVEDKPLIDKIIDVFKGIFGKE